MRKGRNGPEPVSCQSCRSKKLKCDRSRPCSNCSARGITCHFLRHPPTSSESSKTLAGNAELLERSGRAETIERAASQRLPIQPSIDHVAVLGTPAPSPTPIWTDVYRGRDEENYQLENIGTRKDSLLPNVSHGLSIEINDPSQKSDDAPFPNHQPELNPPSNVTLVFPGYTIAVELLRSYESNVNHPCPILYVPTVRARMGTFYHKLKRNDPVPPSDVSLFLSIFAIAAFFYTPSTASEASIPMQDVTRFPTTFIRAALDALDHSRRVTSGTLEDVQAYILLAMLIFQLDGFSARGRMLLMAAIALAKDLRLHKLDASRESGLGSIRTRIDREVNRRVFWYLVSTDWLFSAIGGPQEGTYSIHPIHIDTRLPKYCTDDDIAMIDESYSEGEHRPTAMAYFLQRMKLAHICREIINSDIAQQYR